MASLAGMMLTAPFAGVLTANWNPRIVLTFGFWVLAGLNTMLAFASEEKILFIIRLLQGIGIPFLLTTSMKLMGAVKEKQGTIVAIYVVGTIAGSTLSRFYPAWTAEHFGWVSAFLGAATFMVLASIAVFFVTTKNPLQAQKAADHMDMAHVVKKAICERNLWIAYLAGFGLLFTQSSVLTSLGFSLALKPYSWQPHNIGLIYLACLPAIFFVLAAKSIKNRMAERHFSLMLYCLVWVSMPMMKWSSIFVVFGVMLFAISTYMMQTITTGILGESESVPASIATGFYLAFYYLGGALGSSVSAYAFENWAWKGVISSLAMVHAIIFSLALMIFRRKGRKSYYVRKIRG